MRTPAGMGFFFQTPGGRVNAIESGPGDSQSLTLVDQKRTACRSRARRCHDPRRLGTTRRHLGMESLRGQRQGRLTPPALIEVAPTAPDSDDSVGPSASWWRLLQQPALLFDDALRRHGQRPGNAPRQAGRLAAV